MKKINKEKIKTIDKKALPWVIGGVATAGSAIIFFKLGQKSSGSIGYERAMKDIRSGTIDILYKFGDTPGKVFYYPKPIPCGSEDEIVTCLTKAYGGNPNPNQMDYIISMAKGIMEDIKA